MWNRWDDERIVDFADVSGVQPEQMQLGSLPLGGDEEMDKVLLGMPAAHRSALEKILSLLADVARQEKANSMSSANLGKIFAPSLMRSRDNDLEEESAAAAFAEIATASKVLTRLITTKMAK